MVEYNKTQKKEEKMDERIRAGEKNALVDLPTENISKVSYDGYPLEQQTTMCDISCRSLFIFHYVARPANE